MRRIFAPRLRADGLLWPKIAVVRACTSLRNRPFFVIHRFHEAFASLLIAGVLALAPVGASAQVVDSTVVLSAPGEVVMDGITIEDSADEASLFRGQLRLHRLSLATQASHEVIRLLDYVPGLAVRQRGSSGAALASFRGLGAASTRIQLDGIRLVDPATGSFDLSVLPAALIQSASVSSGTSAGFTPGGEIAMESPERLPAAASYESGSFGLHHVLLQGSQDFRSTTVASAVTRTAFDGDFPYAPPVLIGAPHVRRKGAGRSQSAFFASVHHEFRSDLSLLERSDADGLVPSRSPIHARLLMLGTRVERSIPVLSNAQGMSASQEDDLLLVGLNVSSMLGSMPLHATVSTTRTDFHYVSPDQEATRIQVGEVALRGGISRVLGHQWVLAFEPTFVRSHIQTHDRRHVTERSVRTSLDYVRHGWMMGAYLDARLRSTRPGNDSVTGIERNTALAPGAWWGLRTHRGWEMRVASARVFRLPTLNERYWNPGGNEALQPERGHQLEWQVGYRPTTGRLHARVVVFTSRISNRIVWRPALAGSQRRIWTPDNVARVSGRGLEAYLRWRLGSPWTLTLSGSRIRQVDRSNGAAASYGHQIRFAAPWTASSEAEYLRGRGGLFASWRMTGRRFTATDESTWLPSHHVLDAGAVWRHGRIPLSIQVTASNLLDTSYESSPWMPMPGRAWRAALRLGR